MQCRESIDRELAFFTPYLILRWVRVGLFLLTSLFIHGSVMAQFLPESVELQLKKAGIPETSLSAVVRSLDEPKGSKQAALLLAHRPDVARSPASLMKLLTTQVALDQLGPGFTWKTAFYKEGELKGDGVLEGNVYIKGGGDPKLSLDAAWRMLQKLRAFGIQRIQGDLVFDKSVFEPMSQDPGAFDDQPLRPYNVGADALLINFNALLITFTPDPQAGVARVQVQPPLQGLSVQATVPLVKGPCSDYRAALKMNFEHANALQFKGVYANECQERTWPLVYPKPEEYTERALGGLWRALGGEVSGKVRMGQVPAVLKPLWLESSITLAQVIRDMNKFSNNVMAQQLFLSLSLGGSRPASFEQSQEKVKSWWSLNLPNSSPTPVIDKGSGLSRTESISANGLADLLNLAWRSPWMPEFVASLPSVGQEGTLERSALGVMAHMKTGSLRDAIGVAGFVQTPRGARYIVVAMINDPKASSAKGVLDAIVTWSAQQ
jgi:D-alanyl-D-alanine carboxypeptidase/D-alanyl-D-alanine-endopeptidase (penicillin-binding protein 4)